MRITDRETLDEIGDELLKFGSLARKHVIYQNFVFTSLPLVGLIGWFGYKFDNIWMSMFSVFFCVAATTINIVIERTNIRTTRNYIDNKHKESMDKEFKPMTMKELSEKDIPNELSLTLSPKEWVEIENVLFSLHRHGAVELIDDKQKSRVVKLQEKIKALLK